MIQVMFSFPTLSEQMICRVPLGSCPDTRDTVKAGPDTTGVLEAACRYCMQSRFSLMFIHKKINE